MTLTKEELNLVRQWFDSVQDVNPAYLETGDYILAKKIYEKSGMRVPHSIADKAVTPHHKENLALVAKLRGD